MTRKNKLFTKKFSAALLAVLLVIILIIALVVYFMNTNKTPSVIPASNTGNEAGANNAKGSVQPNNQSGASNGAGNSAASTKGAAGQSQPPNGPPKVPYGDFVSNHYPGQNGSGTSELSTCITTPGAVCYIKFTKGSDSTVLPSRTTDNTGTAYWNWNASILSSGQWKTTAYATANGVTESSQDPMPLTVQ